MASGSLLVKKYLPYRQHVCLRRGRPPTTDHLKKPDTIFKFFRVYKH